MITGNDAQLLTALMAGGAGGVIALAGVYPKLCQKIYDDFIAGNMEGAKAAQDKVHILRSMVRRCNAGDGAQGDAQNAGLRHGTGEISIP